MEQQVFENIAEAKKKWHGCCSGLWQVLTIFVVVLIVSTAVGIYSKAKEAKYIGYQMTTISVTETGEVYAKPDLALTTFSVVTEKAAVAEALAENSERMNAVIDFIKNQGVQDKDLKTTSFNIYPRYEWQEDATCWPPCPNGKRVLVGYEVRQSLQVKIRDMEKIGAVIQGATAAGANEVGNLQFTIDDEDELKKQAREDAIDKAKAKAQELASQLGVKLVKITSFSESSYAPMPRFYGLEMADAGGGAPDIETGENKISVTVTINYEIQ